MTRKGKQEKTVKKLPEEGQTEKIRIKGYTDMVFFYLARMDNGMLARLDEAENLGSFDLQIDSEGTIFYAMTGRRRDIGCVLLAKTWRAELKKEYKKWQKLTRKAAKIVGHLKYEITQKNKRVSFSILEKFHGKNLAQSMAAVYYLEDMCAGFFFPTTVRREKDDFIIIANGLSNRMHLEVLARCNTLDFLNYSKSERIAFVLGVADTFDRLATGGK